MLNLQGPDMPSTVFSTCVATIAYSTGRYLLLVLLLQDQQPHSPPHYTGQGCPLHHVPGADEQGC